MSHDHASLLIELGTEELPPKALDELAGAFAGGVVDGLARRGIAFDAAQAKTFCSPRRLAVLVPGVAARQPPQKSEVLGPYLNIGLDANGAPTPALTGFAAKNGVAIDELQRASDAKGERFVARSEKPGQPTAALLPEILVEALKALPVPKPMRWGDRDFAFVRPAHWLVVLHGDQVVECEALLIADDGDGVVGGDAQESVHRRAGVCRGGAARGLRHGAAGGQVEADDEAGERAAEQLAPVRRHGRGGRVNVARVVGRRHRH